MNKDYKKMTAENNMIDSTGLRELKNNLRRLTQDLLEGQGISTGTTKAPSQHLHTNYPEEHKTSSTTEQKSFEKRISSFVNNVEAPATGH